VLVHLDDVAGIVDGDPVRGARSRARQLRLDGLTPADQGDRDAVLVDGAQRAAHDFRWGIIAAHRVDREPEAASDVEVAHARGVV